MKKLFLIFTAVIYFISCDVIKIEQKHDFIEVAPSNELEFECGESSQILTITSKRKWMVCDLPEWLDVTPQEGESEEEITVSVKEHLNKEDRKGVITISSGSATATINVTQHGAIETNYTNLNLDDKNSSLTYDVNSGRLTITYAEDITERNDYEGKAIVLPAEYDFDIRVIDNSSVSGNTLTLETSQGNMSDMFRNISFTLATSENANTRSTDGKRIITPTAVGYFDEQGQYHETSSIATKDLYFENNDQLWSFHTDYDGETIASGSAGRLYWEKCSFDAELNAVFEFDFGEKQIDEVKKIGEINRFSYTLNGSMDMDFLLHYNYNASYSENKDEIIKKNALKTVVFKFIVGSVPIYITVDTHLGKHTEFSAEGEVNATAGVMLGAELNVGAEWTKEGGARAIMEADAYMDIHHPTLEAEASAAAKVSYYPHIDIKLYKFIGPWVEPRPYLKEDIKAGLRASTDGENYIGWKSETYAGQDLQLGLDITFGKWDFTPWKSNMLNPVEDQLLFDAPARITKISPEDGIEVDAGKTITAEFIVESYSPLTGKYYPCPNAFVIAKVDGGKLEKSIGKSNLEGIAQIKWTPSSNSAQTRADTQTRTMTATVVTADGGVIDDTTLTVETDQERPTPGQWVDLGLPSGIKWAGWNVGASRPEEYGGHYAWGETEEKSEYSFETYKHRERTNYDHNHSAGDDDCWCWDYKDIGDCISGTSYDVAAVRWGGGARMPTLEEIKELSNECSWEGGYVNGVEGVFAIGPNGNSIFIPFAGRRCYSDLRQEGIDGCLWSGSRGEGYGYDYDYNACHLHCNWDDADWNYDGGHRKYGLSVRPVSD